MSVRKIPLKFNLPLGKQTSSSCGLKEHFDDPYVKKAQYDGLKAYFKQLKDNFRSVKTRKPEASRSRSFEIYLVAKGFKGSRPSG